VAEVDTILHTLSSNGTPEKILRENFYSAGAWYRFQLDRVFLKRNSDSDFPFDPPVSASEIVQAVVGAVNEFTGGTDLSDDLTFVVVKITDKP